MKESDKHNLPQVPEKNIDSIQRINAMIDNYLIEHQIDSDNVLFAGYTTGQQKYQGDEHWEESEDPTYFFGNSKSLLPPQEFSDDPEIQDEHWVVNPIYYALQKGTLGIFDKKILETEDSVTEQDNDEVREFGTYIFTVPEETINRAKIVDFMIR